MKKRGNALKRWIWVRNRPFLVLRGVPWGSAVVRCARLPIIHSHGPLCHPSYKWGGRFETTEKLGIGRGMRREGSEKRKSGETRKKGGFEGEIDPFECSAGFRGCPLCPSSHYPVSSTPYAALLQMEGVSKPPKR